MNIGQSDKSEYQDIEPTQNNDPYLVFLICKVLCRPSEIVYNNPESLLEKILFGPKAVPPLQVPIVF